MSSPAEPFDRDARRLRFRRAHAIGDSFFLSRMFDDAAERLAAIARPIDRLLVIGPEQPGWRDRLAMLAPSIDWIDPATQDEDRATLAITVSVSSGLTERKSTTSISQPSASSS